MHLTEGLLRTYLDHELDPGRQEQVRIHLAGCPVCQQKAAEMSQRAGELKEHFAVLSPRLSEASLSPATARTRFQTLTNEKEKTVMFRNMFTRRYMRVWAVLGVIAVLALALSFPQVRAAANSFLGLFRVEKVTVVEFDEANLQNRFNNASLFGDYVSENVKQETIGESKSGLSAADASALVGIPVRLPTTILQGEPAISVMAGERVNFTIDLARLRALVTQLGVQDLELPDSLQGQTVTLQMGSVVDATWGDCRSHASSGNSEPQRCTVFSQMPSPTVNAPSELDLPRIGTALLEVLGMSKSEATSFSNSVDWTSTLVLPIPRGNVDYRYVEVDGVRGVLATTRLYSQGTPQSQTGMIWVKDGVTYLLSSYGWNPNLIEIGNSLR